MATASIELFSDLSLVIILRLLYSALSVKAAEELRVLGEVSFGLLVKPLPGLLVPNAESFERGSKHNVFFQAGVFPQHRREENQPLLIDRALVGKGEIKGFQLEKVFVKTGFLHQFFFEPFPFRHRLHVETAEGMEDKFSGD